MSKKLDPKDVELFLLDNINFFESRESLLSEMKFKDSSSSASSLLERQINKLRDEQKDLMDLLTSFIQTAQLNEDLFNKSKELTLSILEALDKNESQKAEIERFYKKESNKNKLADDLLDQKILEMLKDFSKIKEKDQKTSELEGASNQ